MDIIDEFRDTIRPRLEQNAAELRMIFSNIKISVWCSETGSLTDFKGYDAGIDCLIDNSMEGQPDNVALIIGIKSLTTRPMICDANVVWGHPSGFCEKSLLEGDVVYSKEALIKVINDLPILFDALKIALKRGRPLK